MEPERPERSRDEIASLPSIGTTACLQFLREAGRQLAPETLVYVIREAARARNTELVQLCGRYLIGAGEPVDSGAHMTEAERIIASVGRRFGFDGDDAVLEEFWRACLDAAWRAILEGSERKPFWERAFGRALYAKCIDVGRPLYRRRSKETRLDLNRDRIEVGILEAMIARQGAEMILRAIRDLPEEESHAAMLRWIEKRPIASPDPRAITHVMGLSPRHIHTLLNRARGRLGRHPSIRSLREDS